jgi:hypothetical protein
MDIIKAYRCSPISPDHKRHIALWWKDSVWADHDDPFGLVTAGNIQGTVADATVDILKHNNIEFVVKWVDDFDFLCHPVSSSMNADGTVVYTYSFDLTTIKHITDPLGIPWHDLSEKGHDFAFTTEYAGFFWNLPFKRVSLPNKKRQKFLSKIAQFLHHTMVTATQVASIHSSLQHISFVYRDGRAFLPALSRMLSNFPNKWVTHHISSSV